MYVVLDYYKAVIRSKYSLKFNFVLYRAAAPPTWSSAVFFRIGLVHGENLFMPKCVESILVCVQII